MRKSLGMLAAFVMLAILASGCDRAEPTAPKPASSNAANPTTPRLAVLSPAFAETLRDLGAGDRIVARHGWDSFSPATIPAVGNEGGIDYESLLKANPTHVIMEAGAKEPPSRLSQLASDRGWTILRIPNLTLDDIAHATTALANAAAVDPAIANAAANRFTVAFTRDDAIAQHAGRVLILIGTDPPAVMGPGSFHYEMVERLGADAIPNQGAAFIQWSVEDVLKADPDTLVLILPGAKADDPATNLGTNLGPLAKLNLRCTQRNAVIVITDPKAHLPATSLANIADALHENFTVLPILPPTSGTGTRRPRRLRRAFRAHRSKGSPGHPARRASESCQWRRSRSEQAPGGRLWECSPEGGRSNKGRSRTSPLRSPSGRETSIPRTRGLLEDSPRLWQRSSALRARISVLTVRCPLMAHKAQVRRGGATP